MTEQTKTILFTVVIIAVVLAVLFVKTRVLGRDLSVTEKAEQLEKIFEIAESKK